MFLISYFLFLAPLGLICFMIFQWRRRAHARPYEGFWAHQIVSMPVSDWAKAAKGGIALGKGSRTCCALERRAVEKFKENRIIDVSCHVPVSCDSCRRCHVSEVERLLGFRRQYLSWLAEAQPRVGCWSLGVASHFPASSFVASALHAPKE